jgi:hypothetical protein
LADDKDLDVRLLCLTMIRSIILLQHAVLCLGPARPSEEAEFQRVMKASRDVVDSALEMFDDNG